MAQAARWVTLVAFGWGLAAANAHNNPSFREVWLLSIEVLAEADGGVYSEPFGFDLPKKSIELIWRIDAADAADITFSLAKDGAVVAAGLTDGATSKIMRGEGYVIVDVKGATEPFTLEVLANVIDRSKPADS